LNPLTFLNNGSDNRQILDPRR